MVAPRLLALSGPITVAYVGLVKKRVPRPSSLARARYCSLLQPVRANALYQTHGVINIEGMHLLWEFFLKNSNKSSVHYFLH